MGNEVENPNRTVAIKASDRFAIEEGEYNPLQLALLYYLNVKANPYNGIVRTCASIIGSMLQGTNPRAVLEALGALYDAGRIWYPGETGGKHIYPIFVEGYPRISFGRLRIWKGKGELAPGFVAYVKKTSGLTVVSATLRNRPIPQPTLPGDRVDARADARVSDEERPKPGGSTGGVTGGLPKPESLSIAGVIPTDGGNFRRVIVGAEVRAAPESPKTLDHSADLDPPGGPPRADAPPPASPSTQASPEAIDLKHATEAAREFRLELADRVGWAVFQEPSTADIHAAARLIQAVGWPAMWDTIKAVFKHHHWVKRITTVTKLEKYWNEIRQDLAGDASAVASKNSRKHREDEGAVPGTAKYSSQGDVAELATRVRGRKGGRARGVDEGDPGGVPGVDARQPA